MSYEQYKFEILPLPYDYSALEPYIDTLTMQLHHDRHLQTYVNNLNDALSSYPEYQDWTLDKLIRHSDWLPDEIRTKVKNNAGGVYNHNFFFSNMSPNKRTQPSKELAQEINMVFGSFDNFKDEFKKQALSVFGSGYTWLVFDNNNRLRIINTANQDTPLTLDVCPIITIDVWEHAYYLKHYNKRTDYIDDWFNVVDMDLALQNFIKCISQS